MWNYTTQEVTAKLKCAAIFLTPAMLLLLGSRLVSGFSEVFPDEHLETSTQELNEGNFADLLPSMDWSTPILIEKGFTVGRYQEELLKTIKERDMVVVMKDCQHLYDYAAVCPRGKYVAVKNSSSGRRQHILVMNSGNEFYSSLQKFISKERSAESEPIHYWEQFTTVQLGSIVDKPTDSSAPDWLNDKLRTGLIKAFCTIDIWLYATKTPRKKWIQFKLTDAVGMFADMGSDDKWARGFFNDTAHVYLFPGSGTDPATSQLPSAEWSRPSIQPKTPNSSTKYKSSTGWSFGVSAGVNPNGPSANVTATHKDENEEETVIKDFSVRNISDASMTGWNFYYTAVDRDHWGDHFNWKDDVLPIADLAKSTLTLNTECLYRGPPDSDEKVPWMFQFKFQWACLRGNWKGTWKYMIDYPMSQAFTINMGSVKNPDP